MIESSSENLSSVMICFSLPQIPAPHTTGVKNDTGSFTIGALSNASHYTGRVDEAGFWKNYIPDSTRRDWLYNSGSGRSYTDIYNYGAGAFSLDLKYNSYVSGEFIQMFSAPGGVQQREVFQITSSYTPITGGFRYSAVRNLNDGDGGPFDWSTGDAVTSLAAAVGSGFINMTATSTIVGHDGPATVYYVRNGMGAWDAVAPVVADGNLRSFVDYTDDQFGHAAGNDLLLTPELGFKGYTIDTINGMRTFNLDIAFLLGRQPTTVYLRIHVRTLPTFVTMRQHITPLRHCPRFSRRNQSWIAHQRLALLPCIRHQQPIELLSRLTAKAWCRCCRCRHYRQWALLCDDRQV